MTETDKKRRLTEQDNADDSRQTLILWTDHGDLVPDMYLVPNNAIPSDLRIHLKLWKDTPHDKAPHNYMEDMTCQGSACWDGFDHRECMTGTTDGWHGLLSPFRIRGYDMNHEFCLMITHVYHFGRDL